MILNGDENKAIIDNKKFRKYDFFWTAGMIQTDNLNYWNWTWTTEIDQYHHPIESVPMDWFGFCVGSNPDVSVFSV